MKCQRILYHVSSRRTTKPYTYHEFSRSHQINLVFVYITEENMDTILNNLGFKN